MRNKGSFYRTDEISREPEQSSHWLERFAEKLAVHDVITKGNSVKTASSKTAVEVARNRQPSIYELMSAIVSGQKSKFSSVEEAVQDYQRRTGLADYLQRKANNGIEDLATQIVEASENEEINPLTDNDYAKVIKFPKKERKEDKEEDKESDEKKELAEIIQLFMDDSDPDPKGGGSASEGTLFEVPEDEEYEEIAAADDKKDVADAEWCEEKKA